MLKDRRKSKPVIILGMHRSGTSCLTGCLQEAGLYLGEVNNKAGFNLKGNKENEAIRSLHDEILRRVDASWDNPPADDPLWTSEELAQLAEAISCYETIDKWGLKDPRTLFMMEGWQTLCEPVFVGTYRHPQEVATSLVKRAEIWNQEMSYEKAYDLWCAYNRKLLELHTKQSFPLLRYDIDITLYNEKVKPICQTIGLKSDNDMSFRENRLHNHHITTENVPEVCQEIWETLENVAI